MYVPDHFALDDPADCIDVIERRGVGTLVVATAGGFEATLLPWLVPIRSRGWWPIRCRRW